MKKDTDLSCKLGTDPECLAADGSQTWQHDFLTGYAFVSQDR